MNRQVAFKQRRNTHNVVNQQQPLVDLQTLPKSPSRGSIEDGGVSAISQLETRMQAKMAGLKLLKEQQQSTSSSRAAVDSRKNNFQLKYHTQKHNKKNQPHQLQQLERRERGSGNYTRSVMSEYPNKLEAILPSGMWRKQIIVDY